MERKEKERHKVAKQKRTKRKAVTAVIVDGLVKNSKYKEGGTLYSAGKLARKLFGNLADASNPKAHLVVEGVSSYSLPTSLYSTA